MQPLVSLCYLRVLCAGFIPLEGEDDADLAETMAGTYVSFAFSELIAFGLLVLVLVIRPTGLFQKGV
jgi:branched-subunit amino acid ABC-type transport system permease component